MQTWEDPLQKEMRLTNMMVIPLPRHRRQHHRLIHQPVRKAHHSQNRLRLRHLQRTPLVPERFSNGHQYILVNKRTPTLTSLSGLGSMRTTLTTSTGSRRRSEYDKVSWAISPRNDRQSWRIQRG